MSDGLLKTIRDLFSISDEQAMWRVQHLADHEAFARLVERWQAPVERLCTRMTGDSHRGQDLAQEAFMRLFAQRASYRAEGKFSSFLWRIALNLCYDETRRRQRRSEIPLETEEPGHLSPLDLLCAEEPSADARLEVEDDARIVSGALKRLPEHYRAVLVLKHYHDLKLREIAEVLEIPEGTVKSRLAEGLKHLAKILAPRREDLGGIHPPRPGRREESFML